MQQRVLWTKDRNIVIDGRAAVERKPGIPERRDATNSNLLPSLQTQAVVDQQEDREKRMEKCTSTQMIHRPSPALAALTSVSFCRQAEK